MTDTSTPSSDPLAVTVLGATGRTGRYLVERALDHGHEVVAFVRDPASLGIDHERLRVVVGDAYTGEGVAEAVAPDGDPVDTVVSTLGQSRNSPEDLLTVAGDHVIDAMRDHDVDRLVTLVGAAVRTNRDEATLGSRLMKRLMLAVAPQVLADATEHVKRVTATDLDWTVVRPPRLTDATATGTYRVGYLSLGPRASVSREDLAAFLLECVEDRTYVHELPMVAN